MPEERTNIADGAYPALSRPTVKSSSFPTISAFWRELVEAQLADDALHLGLDLADGVDPPTRRLRG
jgi:hypothetical protein